MAALESLNAFMAAHPSFANGFTLSIAALSGLAFTYFFVLTLPPGLPRFLSILPFLPAYLLLPWTIPFYHARGIVSLIFCWTCPFKLLLLCWDSSVDFTPWTFSSFFHFLAAMLLPVSVKGVTSNETGKVWIDLSGFGSFIAIICLYKLYTFRDLIPQSIIYVMYCVNVFLGLRVTQWIYSNVMYALFKVELDPGFDSPFMSRSLSEFWGKRWNLIVTTILRATVYNPLLHLLSGEGKQWKGNTTRVAHFPHPNGKVASTGRSEGYAINELEAKKGDQQLSGDVYFHKPRLWARAVALLATFLVSGLLHELIFFYLTKSEPTWEVTQFFVLHGIATSAEVALRRSLPMHLKFPTAVSVLFTLTFIYVTTIRLFMPPLCNSGADLKTIAEFHEFQSWMMAFFHR